MPQYLELFDTNLPVKENIEDMLTNQMIVDDAGALLRDQLGDPRNYVAVVEAIASGFTRMSEIAKMAGLPLSNISKYLDVLQHLSVITRQVPATVSSSEEYAQAEGGECAVIQQRSGVVERKACRAVRRFTDNEARPSEAGAHDQNSLGG